MRQQGGPSGGGGGGSDAPAWNYREISSAPYTVASDDVVVRVTTESTLTLPAPTLSRMLVVKAGDFSVILDGDGYDIDLEPTYSMVALESVTLFGTGTEWLML